MLERLDLHGVRRPGLHATGRIGWGIYTLTGSHLSTNENYMTGSGTTALTVNAQTPTVSVSAVSIGLGNATAILSANVAYTGAGVAPSGGIAFKIDSGTTVIATCVGSSSPVMCTYSSYPTSTLALEPHTITATTIGDGNYAAATATNTLTVLPPPTIVFTVLNHHTQDAAFSVSATSNSSGAVIYSVVSGPATILGSTATLAGVAGTVTLQASQAASGGFAAGSQNTRFLNGSPDYGNQRLTGGGVGTIASPLGLAFDASGNIWVTSSNGVSEFSRQGVAVNSTPFPERKAG